jgi:hypothetical protein
MLLVAPGSAAYLVGGISLLTRSGGGLAWVVGGLVGGLVGAVLPASPLAATAEQHALEEVLVDDVTGAAARALIGNLLDALEQRSVNDRVVPTRVGRALVLQDAGVVRVRQDPPQLLQRDGLAGKRFVGRDRRPRSAMVCVSRSRL